MVMGSYESDEALSSPSSSPMERVRGGLRSDADLEDLFEETLFTVSGGNTPTLETAPVVGTTGRDSGDQRLKATVNKSWTSMAQNGTYGFKFRAYVHRPETLYAFRFNACL